MHLSASNLFLLLCTLSLLAAPVLSTCYNKYILETPRNLATCSWYNEESCCTETEAQDMKVVWDKMTAKKINNTFPNIFTSTNCLDELHKMICVKCSPQQLSFIKTDANRVDKVQICAKFCQKMFDTCGLLIEDGYLLRQKYATYYDFCNEGIQRMLNIPVEVSWSDECFNAAGSLSISAIMYISCMLASLLVIITL